MNQLSWDVVVIGSGPGGQKAALQAAKAGKRVLVIESYSALGGGCVHWGTIPSKSFRESVYRYSLGSRGVLGRESDEATKKSQATKLKPLPPEMKRLLKRRERVVAEESRVVTDQLSRNGIELKTGIAQFLPQESGVHLGHQPKRRLTLKGTQEVIEADIVIIATGSRPLAPTNIQVDHKVVFDSDSVLNLKRVPRSMVILGGGIIGCEYASMFSMAGTDVTLMDKRPEILASVDREICHILMKRYESQGMHLRVEEFATKVEAIPVDDLWMARVHTSKGDILEVDAVLVAQGRIGNTEDLILNNIGVKLDERGLISVNERFETSAPGVYAVGDVIGAPALASTSQEQGRLAARYALKMSMPDEDKMQPVFPYGIYTIPEIAMIGETEEQLKAKGIPYIVGSAKYCELARGQIVGDYYGMLKMLVDPKTLKILGVHIVGDSAADLIHIGQAVMGLNGDIRFFTHSVFNYPTLAEAYKVAAFQAYHLAGFNKAKKDIN